MSDYSGMEDFVKKHKRVVVSVRPKGGCKICELYAPTFKKTFEEIADVLKEKDVRVIILPIDKECVDNLNVCSPTVLFYKDGNEVSRIIVENVPLNEFGNVLKKNVSMLIE